MKTSESDYGWEPRIGSEAARSRQSAYQFVRYFYVSGAALIAVAFVAAMSRTMPLWLSILILASTATWLFFLVLTWSTFSIRMKRAGRQAYEYLGRPPQLRRKMFPPVMLVNTGRFDSHMALKGIPPRGSYTPLCDPATARILAKRNRPGV